MGTVLQDAWLFSGTLRENLTLGDPRWSDADLLAAAQLTGAHEFIGAHPEGFDRKVAERGEGLSGGQRQLLCLTRALLGAPPLLLLDEPTSAMDTPSERALIERLAADPTPRTLIVVTHRSSLLALVDRVIVLDKGRVIADGPKEQVLRPASGAGGASGSPSGSASEGTP
jgi:ATP-binding cassette subfamily C protein LapB